MHRFPHMMKTIEENAERIGLNEGTSRTVSEATTRAGDQASFSRTASASDFWKHLLVRRTSVVLLSYPPSFLSPSACVCV